MGESSAVNNNIEAINNGHRGAWRGWFVITAALAGLGVCLYLYSFHIALLMGEIKSGLLCGTDSGLGCNLVSASPYSSLLGLPLALWGAIFYGTLALLGVGSLIFRRDCGQAFLRWAFFLAVLGLAFDLYLAHIMIFRIRAVCWLCIATYIINFAIIIGLVKQVWRASEPRIPLLSIFPGTGDGRAIDFYYRNVIKGLLIGAIVLTAVIAIAGSQFLARSLTGNDRERLVKVTENLLQQTPLSIKVENRPFMGSEDANLTVVEFSDFRCPYCAKASQYIKLAGSGNHDRARIVFRHYPLDKSCNRRLSSDLHPGACMLAEGAACANEQNKFWAYHDIAFETKGQVSRSVVQNIAAKIKLDLNNFNSCLDSGRGLQVVSQDIEAAIDAGVKGTPTLFINGRRLGGVPKPWVLNEILQFSERNFSPAE
ncbi:MAG: vitamin K epoxide reductase family protein [Desulfobacterales bacterium]